MPHRHLKPPAGFAELGLSPALLQSLEKIGFTKPSDIQQQMIPIVLTGRDVLGQARTGTGKTAAFGLPILQMISPEKRLQALVVVPTRELAVQLAAEFRRLSGSPDLHVVPIYGGQKVATQLHLLGKKPHIVVGTPGRIMDLMDRRALNFDDVTFVVLDEVDRMLDIGFRDDIKKILGRVTKPHQTMLVSATLTDDIKNLAQQYMTDPVEVNVSHDELTVDNVAQVYMTVDPWDKFHLLRMILEHEKPGLAIIFCNTKHAARKLAGRLHEIGADAKEIHGDLVQQKRERVMDKFRKHNLHLLVATDLASRGIDVQGITHIINYDVPQDPHLYVHRIGRTARMGSFGRAITFVTREQGEELTQIEALINKEVPNEVMQGFIPRPPPDDAFRSAPVEVAVQANESAGPVVSSRYSAPVFGTEEDNAGPARPKGLGGKFRPARRRRR
jgi:ATP-dependent RNA helicase DeaD